MGGQGYPYGLKGNNIPFGARVLAACDAFEAMTSPRPYRKKHFTLLEAVAEIKKMAGKQFDPHLLDSFLDGIKELLTTERKIYIRDLDKIVTLPELSGTAE